LPRYLWTDLSLLAKGDEIFWQMNIGRKFKKLAEKFGCFIVSRKAYDVVINGAIMVLMKSSFEIIVSQNKDLKLKQNYLC